MASPYLQDILEKKQQYEMEEESLSKALHDLSELYSLSIVPIRVLHPRHLSDPLIHLDLMYN